MKTSKVRFIAPLALLVAACAVTFGPSEKVAEAQNGNAACAKCRHSCNTCLKSGTQNCNGICNSCNSVCH